MGLMAFLIACGALVAPYRTAEAEKKPAEGKKAPKAEWCEQSPDHDCRPAACASGKRVIVLFSAEWCGWCKHMKKNIFPDPAVQEFLSHFALIEVVAEKNEDLMKELGVDRFPSWLIIEKDCDKTLDAFTGASRTVEAFLQRFRPYLAH